MSTESPKQKNYPEMFERARFREYVQNDMSEKAAELMTKFTYPDLLLTSTDTENRTPLHIVFLFMNYQFRKN